MATLIHATRRAVTADEVTYEYVIPPASEVELVVVPVSDPNAFRVVTGQHHQSAARVVARAVRIRKSDGAWPASLTLAS